MTLTIVYCAIMGWPIGYKRQDGTFVPFKRNNCS